MNEEIKALKLYKTKNKLSFDSLSKELDVHIGTVVRWLNGSVNPSPVMRRLIIAFLKVTEGARKWTLKNSKEGGDKEC